MLPHSATVELLKHYGLQCAEYCLAVQLRRSGDAAGKLGFPVILKGVVAEVAHRSDAGLVSHRISNEEELRPEYTALEAKAREMAKGAVVISVEKYFAARLRGDPRREIRCHLWSGNSLRPWRCLY